MTLKEKIDLIENIPTCVNTFVEDIDEDVVEEYEITKETTPNDLPVGTGQFEIPTGVEIYLNGDLFIYAKDIKYIQLGDGSALGKIVAFVSNKDNFVTPKFNTITVRFNDDLGTFNDILIDKVNVLLVASEVSIDGNTMEKVIYFEASSLDEL